MSGFFPFTIIRVSFEKLFNSFHAIFLGGIEGNGDSAYYKKNPKKHAYLYKSVKSIINVLWLEYPISRILTTAYTRKGLLDDHRC